MIRVVELFAGVGGFRLGFEKANLQLEKQYYNICWSNQWEPSTKTQHASEIYRERWQLKPDQNQEQLYIDTTGMDIHSNQDIHTVSAQSIPEHDLLVGGFPCQDYSVAKTLNKADGIVGKKGVLWWDIHRIVSERKPNLVLLENVDRLLKSPTSQRGRDFAVMLAALNEIGYDVEWRVITASEYGMPQRRTRVFILAMKKGSGHSKAMRKCDDPEAWVSTQSVFARAFPVENEGGQQTLFPKPDMTTPILQKDDYELHDVSEEFNKEGKATAFQNSGVMYDGKFYSKKVKPMYSREHLMLGDILLTPGKIPNEFLLTAHDLLREKGWIYQKGGKKEPRKGTNGFTYLYSEGPVTFPDALDRPSRTIITGEGGAGASRFKHVVETKMTKSQRDWLAEQNQEDVSRCREKLGLKASTWVRRLHPIELERLNMMPDNHTKGLSDSKRAFMMGNALVVGIVEKIAIQIAEQ